MPIHFNAIRFPTANGGEGSAGWRIGFADAPAPARTI
jgi:hypothetical protein